MKQNILITGIPGTGKTWMGDYMAQHHNFTHSDIEATGMTNLDQIEGDIVLTWGFVPDDSGSINLITEFIGKGFKLIWFDGNRPAALREFIKRGTVPEELFYLQMFRIEQSKIIEKLSPKLVNTFDDQGMFKQPDVILKEILFSYSHAASSSIQDQ